MIKRLWLARFSKPVGDRALYRLIRRHRPAHVLLVGLGNGIRAVRMLQMALGCVPADQMRLTLIDLFEARPAGMDGLSLKQAHQLLKATASRVQLVPGDPYKALARSANSLRGVDLVVIAAEQQGRTLDDAWFYLPRTLSPRAKVLVEMPGGRPGLHRFAELDRRAIDERAGAAQARKRAA